MSDEKIEISPIKNNDWLNMPFSLGRSSEFIIEQFAFQFLKQNAEFFSIHKINLLAGHSLLVEIFSNNFKPIKDFLSPIMNLFIKTEFEEMQLEDEQVRVMREVTRGDES